VRRLALGAFASALGAASPAAAKCPPDAAQVGPLCVDRYEAGAWLVPDAATKNKGLVKKIRKGKAKLADLAGAGATQLGCTDAPYLHTAFPGSFPANGNWTPLAGSDPATPGIYAVSLPGVRPTACVTWLQAAQLCALSGKRLPSNAEWQRAAAGTPNPEAPLDDTCTVAGPGAAPAGEHPLCVSHWGVFDMAGNLWEWVADWNDKNETACTSWLASDFSCFGGDGSTAGEQIPAPLFRGGSYTDGAAAGPFAVKSDVVLDFQNETLGFRCAR
jgi:hypothetical protein